VRFHWLTHLFRAITKLLTDIFYESHNGQKFSLGRTSFIVWFYLTCWIVRDSLMTHDIVVIAGLPLAWWTVGLSLLGYIIGKQYIVTKLNLLSQNITDIEVSDDEKDGPH